jgi:hypothetical protein
VSHDFITDFIQLLAALLPAAIRLEWTKRRTDTHGHMGAAPLA